MKKNIFILTYSLIILISIFSLIIVEVNEFKFKSNNTLDEQIKIIEEYQENYPEDDRALYNLAFRYYKTQQFEKAEKAYIKYLENNSEDALAIHQLALVYERKIKIKQAIQLRKTIEEYQPNNLNNLNNLAIDYLFIDTCVAEEYAKKLFNIDGNRYKKYFEAIREYNNKIKNNNVLKAFLELLDSNIFIVTHEKIMLINLIKDRLPERNNSNAIIYDNVVNKLNILEKQVNN